MIDDGSLYERMAIAETLIKESKNIIEANQVSIRKIQARIIDLDAKWIEMSKKLDDMNKYFELITVKIDTISEDLKEQKIIDKAEIELIEKQRKKFITIAGTLGAIFLALVEQYDVIIKMITKLAGGE